jgi:chitinase
MAPILTSVTQALAVFEYMNSPEASLRFNQVRQAVRIQFGHIESTTGQGRLVAWWDVWSADMFATVARTARSSTYAWSLLLVPY